MRHMKTHKGILLHSLFHLCVGLFECMCTMQRITRVFCFTLCFTCVLACSHLFQLVFLWLYPAHTHMHTHKQKHTHTHVHTHTHKHKYTQTHIHIHIHI